MRGSLARDGLAPNRRFALRDSELGVVSVPEPAALPGGPSPQVGSQGAIHLADVWRESWGHRPQLTHLEIYLDESGDGQAVRIIA